MRERLCGCGLHWRDDPEYPNRIVSLDIQTEIICHTTPSHTHVQYEPGRRWVTVSIRVPEFIAKAWFWFADVRMRKVVA